ncbi:nuclear transport factor 2 family protein [Streptomyces carpinensis]|uniref:Nuclear transport factor 2 family protein n=1 Tax=Streptomyces carpinensis TaxID=66369 RepID=A0ABV1VZ56_9ACTN|nr:nuclear transport factor 2 family protein [Streptomyces carpinensis]
MTETETETADATTAQHGATVERYVRFWNAETPEEQQRLASATFTDEVQYYAPIGVLSGPPALIGFREQFGQHMGKVAFNPRQEPQIHHERARLMWEIDNGGTRPFATGTDIMTFAPNGRITTITTFLDQPPEGFDPNAHH